MKRRSSDIFDILLIGLKDGTHHFEYEIGESFFAKYEEALVEKGALKAQVELEKNSRHISCTFAIKGFVQLECDRSSDRFEYPIALEYVIIFKYGDQYEELSEDLITIPYEWEYLNLASYIYELIGIEIPMKKLHPRYADEADSEDDDDEMIYSSNEEGEDEETENQIDPRWEGLKNFK